MHCLFASGNKKGHHKYLNKPWLCTGREAQHVQQPNEQRNPQDREFGALRSHLLPSPRPIQQCCASPSEAFALSTAILPDCHRHRALQEAMLAEIAYKAKDCRCSRGLHMLVAPAAYWHLFKTYAAQYDSSRSIKGTILVLLIVK